MVAAGSCKISRKFRIQGGRKNLHQTLKLKFQSCRICPTFVATMRRKIFPPFPAVRMTTRKISGSCKFALWAGDKPQLFHKGGVGLTTFPSPQTHFSATSVRVGGLGPTPTALGGCSDTSKGWSQGGDSVVMSANFALGLSGKGCQNNQTQKIGLMVVFLRTTKVGGFFRVTLGNGITKLPEMRR